MEAAARLAHTVGWIRQWLCIESCVQNIVPIFWATQYIYTVLHICSSSFIVLHSCFVNDRSIALHSFSGFVAWDIFLLNPDLSSLVLDVFQHIRVFFTWMRYINLHLTLLWPSSYWYRVDPCMLLACVTKYVVYLPVLRTRSRDQPLPATRATVYYLCNYNNTSNSDNISSCRFQRRDQRHWRECWDIQWWWGERRWQKPACR